MKNGEHLACPTMSLIMLLHMTVCATEEAYVFFYALFGFSMENNQG
jgi:hypothetical protein